MGTKIELELPGCLSYILVQTDDRCTSPNQRRVCCYSSLGHLVELGLVDRHQSKKNYLQIRIYEWICLTSTFI